jgi:hypothetical protein
MASWIIFGSWDRSNPAAPPPNAWPHGLAAPIGGAGGTTCPDTGAGPVTGAVVGPACATVGWYMAMSPQAQSSGSSLSIRIDT